MTGFSVSFGPVPTQLPFWEACCFYVCCHFFNSPSLLEAIPFFKHQVFRETILSLKQWQFKWVPPPQDEVLRTAFEGWGQTAINENGFNVIRDHARDVKHGQQSRILRYMQPHSEEVMGSFARAEIEPRPADRGCNSRHLRKGMFDALGGQPSIEDALLRKIMVSHPDWPRYTPQSVHSIPAAFSLLLHVAATDMWDRVAEAWMAAFFVRGSVVQQKSSGRFFLVLDPGQFAVLVWPCEKVGGPMLQIKPMICTESAPSWLHVFDYSDWEAYEVKPLSPLQVRCNGLPAAIRDAVHLTLPAGGEAVLKHAARHAFGSVTDHLLGRLIAHLELEPADGEPPPRVIWERLEMLTKHFLPDVGSADLAEILAIRHKPGKTGAGTGQAGALDDPVAMDCTTAVLDGTDAQECKAHVEEMKATKVSAVKLVQFLQLRKLPVPRHLEGVRHKVAGQAKATPTATKETVQLLRGNAKKYLPKVKGVVLQPYPSERRYQIYYPTLAPPRSKVERWTADQGVTEAMALKVCLAWAWAHHSAQTGEQCPFEFV